MRCVVGGGSGLCLLWIRLQEHMGQSPVLAQTWQPSEAVSFSIHIMSKIKTFEIPSMAGG